MNPSSISGLPVQITFRHTDRSDALESRIHELAEKLTRFHDRITSCRVTVEGPAQRPERHGEFQVSFDVAFPGGSVHATSGHASRAEHADPYIALRDAFENAKRQLASREGVH